MMFALGFVWMFMIGGFSGIMHSAAPADAQQQDSYFVIAHFHYVLIGGSLFALLAGIHYWFPLMFGRKVREFWGKLSFWLIFVGFNITFFPMHFLGLNGMPRRTFTYDTNLGWNEGNFVRHHRRAHPRRRHLHLLRRHGLHATSRARRSAKTSGTPARSSGAMPTPPPEHNYRVPSRPSTPVMPSGMSKQHKEEIAKERGRARQGRSESHGGIHMPHQSIYPFVASLRPPDRRRSASP